MKFKGILLIALMLLGTAAPAMAQNLTANDLRIIRQNNARLQKAARARTGNRRLQRKQRAYYARHGSYGLATTARPQKNLLKFQPKRPDAWGPPPVAVDPIRH